jgi:hypothetical protein
LIRKKEVISWLSDFKGWQLGSVDIAYFLHVVELTYPVTVIPNHPVKPGSINLFYHSYNHTILFLEFLFANLLPLKSIKGELITVEIIQSTLIEFITAFLLKLLTLI